ncbi:MATE family efflux transporter [Parendozoicomonas sp. Alg238-R29]|uniref:MATE family efflux transporter n=1 Tax=Parendozoicomonas sp. Alg238-R29 TaxID=2993446 RepID=UPI00248D6013|nr:MATE family efflux transporter [Parendozoicomonas sp. Alg238-R29]
MTSLQPTGGDTPLNRLSTILLLSFPIIGGMLSQSLLNLVDTAMVGHLGSDALAAIGTANYAIFVCFALISGLSVAVQSRVARLHGQGRLSRLLEPLESGVRITLLGGIPLTALLFFCAPLIIGSFRLESAIAIQAESYFQIRILSLPAGMLMLCFRGFWNGCHSPWSYLKILVATHIVNACLSYILIFGELGLPVLGLPGAAIGTLFAMYCSAMINTIGALRYARKHNLPSPKSRPEKTIQFYQQAWPDSAQQTLFALGMAVFFWLIAGMGSNAMAVSHVLVNISLLLILPGLGIGMASTTLINHAIGAGNLHRAWRWGMDVSFAALAVMALLSLPLLLIPEQILKIFLAGNLSLVETGVIPLQLLAISIIADSASLVLTQSLLGTGSNRAVMKIRFSTLWLINLPLTALAINLDLGLSAVWAIQIIPRLLASLCCLYTWHQCTWCQSTRPA